MKYQNKQYKKTKNTFDMLVICGVCKYDILNYEKLGKGNLLRAHVSRIKGSNTLLLDDLKCPKCENILGHLIYIKEKDSYAYKMIRSKYNTKI